MSNTGSNSGALFEVSGFWPVNATISEDVYFQESGSPMDLTGLDFKLTLRCDEKNTSADYTLSIDSGELEITTDDDGVEILRITVDPGALANPGDYVADLASQDANSVVTLWAHGTITLRNNPVTF